MVHLGIFPQKKKENINVKSNYIYRYEKDIGFNKNGEAYFIE